MAKVKRKIPQINSSAAADIAFLMLIFFLITSSLDPNMGLYRKMSTETSEEILKNHTEIENRNIIRFVVSEENIISLDEEPLTLFEVKELSKTFIDNPNNLDYLPKKIEMEIAGLGTYPVTAKHIISLEIDRNARYEIYIQLLNVITAAYNELREEAARNLYHKSFFELLDEQKEVLRQIYPVRIAEKETENGKELAL